VTDLDLKVRLARSAAHRGLAMTDEVSDRFVAYFQLLRTWNRKINLTGFDLDDLAATPGAIDRLLLEPLAAAKLVPDGFRTLIDIGSGGGSPGLPIAIAANLKVLLVEARVRKSAFLAEAIRALRLTGARVEARRYEELLTRPDLHEKHDLLSVRAVKIEDRTLAGLQAFLRPGGQLFLFTGQAVVRNAAAVRPPLVWAGAHPLLASGGVQLEVLTKSSPS